jgi:hypothetical protein
VSTIPARLFSNVIPQALAPGGTALDTVGLLLNRSRRVPVGTVASFTSDTDISDFFGASSNEAALAPYYFSGFVNATAQPGSLLMAQCPVTGMPAWLEGGDISTLTIPQLQGISGTLSVVMDGYTYSANSINLSADTSFSAAAGTIQTALNSALASGGTSTASTIASETSGNFTASIAGNVLYVTTTPTTPLVPGAIVTGSGVTADTQIVNQLSGAAGGIGEYAVTQTQSVTSETMTATWGLMTIGGTVGGSFSIGQTVTGTSVTSGTQITALGTGTGAAGTYIVSPAQAISSEALDSSAPPLSVTYDSVSGGFLITSGFSPPACGSSTAAYATGTAAASLMLTQATGAVLSKGGMPQTPAAFMNGIAAITQDWFSFTTSWDPDDANGNVGQNAQKMAFAAWTSQQQDTPYAYIAEDTDISPSETVPASSSMGQLIEAQNLSGTMPIWNPNGAVAVNTNPYGSRAMFVMGIGASVNWNETQGRVSAAYKSSPAGLIADVTTETVAVNLGGDPQNIGNGQPVGGNGYNYYGAVGSAAQNFIFLYPGSISGPFSWFDSFENQAFFNTEMQNDILTLMTTIKSFPYNPRGYTLMAEALTPTIQQMLNFGAIQPNVPLSPSQASEVNTAAGLNIANILSTRGWYLQILPASATTRAARGSPPCKFWYTDGGSIQSFNMTSVDVQ